MSVHANGNWKDILSRLSSILLKTERWKAQLTREEVVSGWCGQPAAADHEILVVEQRLGIALPPSYRSFLSLSNGWRPFGSFIERLLPVQEVERFRSRDPETLAMIQKYYQESVLPDELYLDYENPKYVVALRPRYYADCLLVGKGWGVESDIVLLNPHIVNSDGEWEAIFFANWVPGNQRYRSFRDFVEESVSTLENIESSGAR